MCHSVLMLCPSCKSNIRHLHQCSSGTKISSDFQYTTLTAEVCAANESLLSVRFEYGICSDCIRYAKADAKAAQEANAKMEEWHQDLDVLTQRTVQQGRTSALRPSASARRDRHIEDKEGGRKALLRLWYEDAKKSSLRALVSTSGPRTS